MVNMKNPVKSLEDFFAISEPKIPTVMSKTGLLSNLLVDRAKIQNFVLE